MVRPSSLIAAEPCALYFNALTYRCDGEDGMVVAVRMKSDKLDPVIELVFRFRQIATQLVKLRLRQAATGGRTPAYSVASATASADRPPAAGAALASSSEAVGRQKSRRFQRGRPPGGAGAHQLCRLLYLGDDLLRSIAQIVGGHDRRGPNWRGSPCLAGHIGAFQTHHQRNRAGSRPWLPGTMPLAITSHFMIPPKMLTRMPFDRRVLENDLEGCRHLLGGGAAAHVEEVGGEGTVQLDDIHRRHGEACAVDHAADVAVELDVGEVIFAGFDFGRVFLGLVAQGFDIAGWR